MSNLSESLNRLSPLQRALFALKETRARLEAIEGAQTEPIAIIGMGCRFPGGASNPAAYWRLLRDGIDAITEVPAHRWDVNAFYNANPATPGKMNTRWGGFLGQVDLFDARFFGISPREAAGMDPQQRLLLEVSWEALEHAGQTAEGLAGSRTGVFIGISTFDYSQFQLGDPAVIDAYVGTGTALSIAANRLSYLLDLQGPSLAVDTACSSSLVAAHYACQSLRSGESSLAIAGGVNLILSPDLTIMFSQLRAMAADGRCKTFDARADGYVRGEGCGIVILKRLSDALKDGDTILALIRGSAVNQDGRSNGLTAPNGLAQQAVIRQALENARVLPAHIRYVETHGTGTPLGDPIEVQALATVLGQGRAPDQPCVLGSVKTNIGHLEAAAGIAGLIKAVLALRHGEIPPHLHLQQLNPLISWGNTPLEIATERCPFPQGEGPLAVGVSAFGFGGTNAHVVLEAGPHTSQVHKEAPAPGSKVLLLPLSAHSPDALAALVRAYQEGVVGDAEDASSLEDLCYTASVRRTHHSHRLALVVHSRQELAAHLEAFLQGEMRLGMSAGHKVPGHQHKLVFVFPGQGSQWLGMGRALLAQEPVFRDTIARCDQAMQPYVDWSVGQQLTAEATPSRLHEVDVIQPTLFAMQVALATLWRSWGITPDAVVGQSMGEVAAAYVAGALSLEDAACVICRRSQLVKALSGRGGMAVVGLSLAEARRAVVGYENRLSVAVSSSPSSTVLSGDMAALQEVVETLAQRDIFCNLVKVDYASHSPHMDPLQADVLRALEGLQPRPASLPIYSTVTGDVSNGLAFHATYWWRNLREPVLFSAVVQQLLASDHNIFVEISPHPIVSSAIQQGLAHRGCHGVVLPSLRREQEEQAVLLGSFGALYTLGYPVDWSRLYPSAGTCVRLPSYPWQREHFWWDQRQTKGSTVAPQRSARYGRPGAHPLLGPHCQSAAHTGIHFWDMELGTDGCPYLDDHRLQGSVVLPAAAYVEMVLAAATEAFGPGQHALEQVTFPRALFLPEGGTRRVQLVVSSALSGTASFQYFSRQEGEAGSQAAWTLHATGTIRLDQTGRATLTAGHSAPEAIRVRCQEAMSGVEHYRAMQERGLPYGPSFQGVEQLWRQEGEAIGQLHLPEAVASEADLYQIHPVLLDACFQVVAATLPRADARLRGTYLPVGLECLRLYGRPGAGRWSHALLRPGTEAQAETLEGDVHLLSDDGQVVLEVLGLRLQRLGNDTPRTTPQVLSDWLYAIQWEHQERLPQHLGALPPDQRGCWLIFTDSTCVGETLASRLEARGESCVMVSPGAAYRRQRSGHYQLNPARPEEFRQLLGDAFGSDWSTCRGVIHLWNLEVAPPAENTPASLEAAQVLGCVSVLHLVQALAGAGLSAPPCLWLVTRGAQAVREGEAVAISQASLWGLGRTIVHEHPELCATLVDLSASETSEELDALFQDLWSDDREDQIALRGQERYVARLMRQAPKATEVQRQAVPGDYPCRLEISTPGILEHLTLRATTRRQPGPGEVELRVYAAGLNFRDVMFALGLLPLAVELGWECVGKVVALGEGVEGLQVGEDVVAAAYNSFGTYVTTDARLVFPKPAHLSFAEAATIPIAFATAYYALCHVGRLSPGERVLIHAASGGVGLAAVQLAQMVGAEIFATAGSPEKREFLRGLGVKHVMDSRSLAFAEEVLERTGGEGVDVVLNSLAGEAIPKGFSILRAFGRFVELGKSDIYQNTQLGLRLLQNNLSFCVVDLEGMLRQRPAQTGALIRDILRHFAAGALNPLPFQVFSISQVESAFRHMAQARHIGKIVISLQEREVLVAPASEQATTFRSDGTYL
ncbi:MAG TPA: beta-ketoacyl synthase N-terminal-like domain-containing protein, partial [Candidatus Tectomicrobia bacterium]